MRRALALALLVTALLALGGCGGSDGGETDTAASAQSTGQAQTEGQAQEQGGGSAKNAVPSQGALPTEGGGGSAPTEGSQGGSSVATDQSKGQGGGPDSPKAESRKVRRQREAYERKRFGEPSPQSVPFAKYSGPASEGKLHLAEFGDEAGGAERGAVGSLVSGYLGARRAGELARACELLHAGIRAEVAKLAAEQEGGGCPEGLRLADGLGPPNPYFGPADVASLRAQQGAGFALFRGEDGNDYWIAVRQEGGEWRIFSVLPLPFR